MHCCSSFHNLHSTQSQVSAWERCSDCFVCCLSSPSLKPGFRGKQNLLHEGKIGFSVFSIHMWSSHFPASPALISCKVAFHGEMEFPYLVLDFSSPLRGCTGRTSVLDLLASQQPVLPSVADLLLRALEKQNPFLEEDGRIEADKGKPARTQSGDQMYKISEMGFPVLKALQKWISCLCLCPACPAFGTMSTVCIPCMMIKGYFLHL